MSQSRNCQKAETWPTVCFLGIEKPKGDLSTTIKLMQIYALPHYVAACHGLLIYDKDDYEERAWTRSERVVSYAFNEAGLNPFLIGEDFKYDFYLRSIKIFICSSIHKYPTLSFLYSSSNYSKYFFQLPPHYIYPSELKLIVHINW